MYYLWTQYNEMLSICFGAILESLKFAMVLVFLGLVPYAGASIELASAAHEVLHVGQLVDVDAEQGPSAGTDPVHHGVLQQRVALAAVLQGGGQSRVEVPTRVVKCCKQNNL